MRAFRMHGQDGYVEVTDDGDFTDVEVDRRMIALPSIIVPVDGEEVRVYALRAAEWKAHPEQFDERERIALRRGMGQRPG